ncbi:MAG TPA: hypothetical protein VGL81_28880 [Polyangiaceae bacterium]|jgi:hypothetical protein
MWNKVIGLAFSAALVGVVAVSNGCSSSSAGAGGGGDGGSDTGVVVHKEAGGSSSSGSSSGDDSGGEAGVGFDGTSGKACMTDADCNGGAGVNKCSIDYEGTVTGLKVEFWPSPICLPALPMTAGGGNCDPCGISAGGACSDGAIWGCDSDPTTLDPTTSPGLCLPNDATAPVANQGTCIPRCQMPLDGSKATGVTAPNTCVAYTWLEETTGTVIGLGFIQGTCQADADCSGLGTGWVCQVDIGFCTQATAQKTRSKAIGTACTSGTAATSDSTTGACNCVGNNTTNVGYCSSACVVGGNACPNGYVCDAFYPSGPLVFGDASTPALTMQNTGVAGTCIQPCAVADAGAGADGGQQCPTNSSCLLETLEGPDCLP